MHVVKKLVNKYNHKLKKILDQKHKKLHQIITINKVLLMQENYYSKIYLNKIILNKIISQLNRNNKLKEIIKI